MRDRVSHSYWQNVAFLVMRFLIYLFYAVHAREASRALFSAEERLYERGRRLRDNCVRVGAQLPHSLGNPIRKRQCSAFNWAGLAVAAGNPFAVVPTGLDVPVLRGRDAPGCGIGWLDATGRINSQSPSVPVLQ